MSPRAPSSAYEVWHVSCLIYPSVVLRTGFAIGWVTPLSRAVYQQACGRGSLSLSPVSLPALMIYTAFVTQSNWTSSKYGGRALHFFFLCQIEAIVFFWNTRWQLHQCFYCQVVIIQVQKNDDDNKNLCRTCAFCQWHIMCVCIAAYCTYSLMALFTRQQWLDEDKGSWRWAATWQYTLSTVSRPDV